MPVEGELFSVAFEVPGNPRGKGAGRAGMRGSRAMIYTDSKTRSEMGAIKMIASAAMQGKKPYDGAIILRICAYRGIPASWSPKKRAAALAGDILPTSRPDYTNYAKMEDALNEVVWKDDALIVTAVIHKRFSDQPRLVVDARSMASP